MRQHSPAIALLVTLLLAAASPPAVGAEEGSADGRMKKFERLVAAGVEFYRNEEYEDALQTFRSARSLIDHPKLSYKIGRTLQQLGRCEPARKAFERYLDYDELTEAD
ncbi:MAG: hypothetical protein ABEL76_08505, partial [Bradymonadaceae bacterium]